MDARSLPKRARDWRPRGRVPVVRASVRAARRRRPLPPEAAARRSIGRIRARRSVAWKAIANRSLPLSADAEARQEPILRRRTLGARRRRARQECSTLRSLLQQCRRRRPDAHKCRDVAERVDNRVLASNATVRPCPACVSLTARTCPENLPRRSVRSSIPRAFLMRGMGISHTCWRAARALQPIDHPLGRAGRGTRRWCRRAVDAEPQAEERITSKSITRASTCACT